MTDFNESIRLNPKSSGPFNRRAIVHELQQRFDKALADYSAALQNKLLDKQVFGKSACSYCSRQESESQRRFFRA
jgi:hypothetical protein